MAEFYTTEYAASFVTEPRGNNLGYHLLPLLFNYTQVANGTAADTILLRKVPPHGVIDMYASWIAWSGWTSGATLSLGWQAYKDEDGATVAASAAGLLSVVSLTSDGAWSHGMLVVATPDDSIPVVGLKVFNNREPVTLFVTIGTQAPGAADTFQGMLACYVS
jgi:hypothetical protein